MLLCFNKKPKLKRSQVPTSRSSGLIDPESLKHVIQSQVSNSQNSIKQIQQLPNSQHLDSNYITSLIKSYLRTHPYHLIKEGYWTKAQRPPKDMVKKLKKFTNAHHLTKSQMKYLLGQSIIINCGSFGCIRKCLHTLSDGKHFVIKTLNPEIRNKKKVRELVETLRHEERALRRFHHPNIVKYFGRLEVAGVPFLFLEYANCGSLQQILQSGVKFNAYQISYFTFQILQALKYLHQQGFQNNDLKAANILLFENGKVKLCDFGTLRRVSRMQKNEIIGTQGWIAPEFYDPFQTPSPYADIWSLGCTVYELYEGRSPFERGCVKKTENSVKYFQDDFFEDLVAKSSIDPLGANFIKCCLKVDPLSRKNVLELMVHPFVSTYHEKGYRDKENGSKTPSSVI